MINNSSFFLPSGYGSSCHLLFCSEESAGSSFKRQTSFQLSLILSSATMLWHRNIYFTARIGLRCLDMTACHTVGISGLGILGEKTVTYVGIQTSLAGREKLLFPLTVADTLGNPSHLVMKSQGPGGQRKFSKWHILFTKVEEASG